MPPVRKLRVDIWSDIVCPWCYVGKRHFEQALTRFSHASDVSIVWRAFELDPSAPRVHDAAVSYAERIARKYGLQPAQAQAMIDRLVGVAATAGLEMRFDRIRPGNTFDAHRLLHLAHAHGCQDALKERFLRAYFSEGQAIGVRETLAALGGEVGLPEADVNSVLDGDRYRAAVWQDEAIARELGITGVPFFVIAGRVGVSGAQPADVLLGALERGWSELSSSDGGRLTGPVCGPDGCDRG